MAKEEYKKPEDKKSEGHSDYLVPEEFQRKVYELLDGANEQMIDYCQDCCYKMMNELHEKEKPAELSTEGMPD